MVQYQALDRTFKAVADPTRRAILEQLGHGPATISQLAAPFGMSLNGLKKHVRVLEDARLVATVKQGRVRECRLIPGDLDPAIDWMQMYRQRWERRLDGLETAVDGQRRTSR